MHAFGISWLQALMRCSWQPSMLLGSWSKAPLGPLPLRKLVRHAPTKRFIAQWEGMPMQLHAMLLATSEMLEEPPADEMLPSLLMASVLLLPLTSSIWLCRRRQL